MELTDNELLLTILLRHDQAQNLEQIQGRLAEAAWWERFPPPGVEIVSWHVVMGIGQIVTLKVPAHRINEVNVELERSAWGVFRTETYPTYDFMPVRERLTREWRERVNRINRKEHTDEHRPLSRVDPGEEAPTDGIRGPSR